jgi:hypothetical protein
MDLVYLLIRSICLHVHFVLNHNLCSSTERTGKGTELSRHLCENPFGKGNLFSIFFIQLNILRDFFSFSSVRVSIYEELVFENSCVSINKELVFENTCM